MKPFFKWSGGKRRETKVVRRYMPVQFDTFYEPFLGGGAIWLDLEHDKNVVNDSYPDVMNFYKVLKSDTHDFIKHVNQLSTSYAQEMSNVERDPKFEKQIEEVKGALGGIHDSNFKKVPAMSKSLKALLRAGELDKSKLGSVIDDLASWEEQVKKKRAELKALKEEMNKPVYEIANNYYYYYRNNDFGSDFDKAVQFYILRQLSFSGMLRFDGNGKFNVPYGWYKSFKGIEERPESVKDMLDKTQLMCCDWKDSLATATKDDFVFLDPPYTRAFTDYHPNGQFGDQEHRELAEWFKTTNVPTMIILNRDEFTESLYGDYILDDYDFKYSIQYRDRMTEKDSNAKHFIATNYKKEC